MRGAQLLSELQYKLNDLASDLIEGLSLRGGTAVGLSIGTSSIKLVELKKVGKGWKLLHFGIVQLPSDVISNREIVNQIPIVESIKTLVSQIKLGSKNVCISLSGTSMIIKRMSLEVQNKRELSDQVFWEAEQYLPFDVSEVVMDFHVLSGAKESKTDVVLVAVKRSVLDSYMACVEEAGLRPKIVDSDFFALQNVFEVNYSPNPSEAVAVIDIGAAATKIVVVHNGGPVFTKDSSLGGANLTDEIQRSLNLSYSDAETLKMGAGGPIPQEVSDLMQIMAENLASEIKRSLDFYNASSAGAPVAFLLLAGGGAKIPNLSKTVEDVTGLPTQIINPFNSLSYDSSVFTTEYLSAIAPIAAVPIGLALRAGMR